MQGCCQGSTATKPVLLYKQHDVPLGYTLSMCTSRFQTTFSAVLRSAVHEDTLGTIYLASRKLRRQPNTEWRRYGWKFCSSWIFADPLRPDRPGVARSVGTCSKGSHLRYLMCRCNFPVGTYLARDHRGDNHLCRRVFALQRTSIFVGSPEVKSNVNQSEVPYLIGAPSSQAISNPCTEPRRH